jgi:hypothetical protein
MLKHLLRGVAILLLAAPVFSAPPSNLLSLLDTQMPLLECKGSTLSNSVHRIRWLDEGATTIQYGIERIAGVPEPKFVRDVPAGTLRSQLNAITEQTGYVWMTNDKWINLVPKEQATDPGYVMNQKLPGRIVIRRDGLGTPIKDWFASHNISTARDTHGLKFPGAERIYGEDEIVLSDPTLRDYYNARMSTYGDQLWTVTITVFPPREAGGKPLISILEWSAHRYKMPNWHPTAPK